MALSDRERRFVDSYLKTWNKTRAAMEAGYSAKTAGSVGFEIYNRPHVKEAIKERMEDHMGTDEALRHVASIARGEWAAAFTLDAHGNVVFDGEKAEELGLLNLIQETSPVPKTDDFKYKFPSRMDALKTILGALGVLKGTIDDTDVNRFLFSLLAPRAAEVGDPGSTPGKIED